ncbi:WD40/YVTN/BNR-like repeat-containing protein [Flaviaesturariibacter amylovorans]|uniref:Sortilin N-terminal domain-containing protein n=1 Tax=Flaviaesturariibacter amylovorans TaxID=1084520 RepID=A0ABP8HPM4_9BACT
MTRILYAFLALITCLGAHAQQRVSLDQFKNWKPRNFGPSSMSGRVTTIDVVLSDPNTWYIGAASGGVWKTSNAGGSWTPLFDEQPTLNIGSLAIQQSNPNIVWVGTGEGNPRNSINIGEGIYKTLDGGRTWKRMGLEKTRNIHRILIDPTNPDVVYAGVIGNPYAEHPERGVYKTTDGGNSWKQVLYTNDTSGVGDMVMDPSNPNKILVNMWQHRRTPHSFKSGGPGSGLYLTMDGGTTWKKLGKEDGLPGGNLGRCGLAFARSQPTRVYALVEAEKNGLYKSDDGGFKWELITAEPRIVTNRPFYFQDIAVDTKNENRIYSIHDIVEVSEDGGRSFRTLLPYSGIHPDHHAWWISPEDPNFILDGNDGGMGITRDRGRSWTFPEGLPLGQFYHVNVDNEMPYNAMGGLQDNGSWHGPAYTWTNGGIRNYYWNNVGGGDGFDVMPDPENADWVYSMSQQGYLNRMNWKTGERWFLRPPTTDLSQKFRFNWNAGIAQDPFDKNTIYFASQYVHKSTNKGASWTIISPDLTTNVPAQQNQDENGGLTLDVTGAENYNTILAIEPSRLDRNVLWVGTDDGNVQLTRDGGKTWTNFRGKIPGMPVGAWIPQVRASRYNAGEVFVVANDYRRGDFKPYIFRTTDYGKTWTRLVDEKKVRGYALCMIQDPAQPNLIFVGTEHGLWVSLDNGANFQQWKNGYPSVSTYDLAIQEREADLVIATFGRSLWVLDDIRPLRQLAAANGTVAPKRLMAYAAPDAIQAQYRLAPGYEWSTYGIYDAPNRPRGAQISYWVTPSRDTAVKVSDSLNVRIYNDRNELVRSLKWKADSGFNRRTWFMEEKGYRSPGSQKPRPNAPEIPGLQAMPGTYKVVLTLGKESDSTMVTLRDDPRLNKPATARASQRRLMEELRKTTDRLTEAMDRLAESEEALGKISSSLRGLEGKETDSLRKATTRMQDSIKVLREYIGGKKNEKQGLSRDNDMTVLAGIQLAQGYIMSKSAAPGEQEHALVANAGKLIDAAVERVNAFYAMHWKTYRKQYEATQVNLFKEYEPIR